MIHNILICDADRRLLAFHEGLLRHAGYRVSTAQDMRTLSTQLRSVAFSLVIAELAFPGCDANDAVNVVRQTTTLQRRTPILVLTSNTDPEAHRSARAFGVWDISVKPAPCTELLGLVRNILEDAYPESFDCLARPGAAQDHRRLPGRVESPRALQQTRRSFDPEVIRIPSITFPQRFNNLGNVRRVSVRFPPYQATVGLSQ